MFCTRYTSMLIACRRTVNHAVRVTCPAMHRVMLPAAIVTAYYAFSGAAVIIPAHWLAMDDHMAVVPMHAAKEKEGRKANAWRPVYIAMVMVVYMVSPANWRDWVPPITVDNMWVVIWHINHISLARLYVNNFSAAFSFSFNFNVVVSYQVTCVMSMLPKHLNTI